MLQPLLIIMFSSFTAGRKRTGGPVPGRSVASGVFCSAAEPGALPGVLEKWLAKERLLLAVLAEARENIPCLSLSEVCVELVNMLRQ